MEINLDNLYNYRKRILITGSRHWNDYTLFCKVILHYISLENINKESIVFITGLAKSGADKLIVDFCNDYNFDYVGFPANWNVGKQAGYIRNLEMIKYCTEVIGFWDMKSNGTKHSLKEANKLNIPTSLCDIEHIKYGHKINLNNYLF